MLLPPLRYLRPDTPSEAVALLSDVDDSTVVEHHQLFGQILGSRRIPTSCDQHRLERSFVAGCPAPGSPTFVRHLGDRQGERTAPEARGAGATLGHREERLKDSGDRIRRSATELGGDRIEGVAMPSLQVRLDQLVLAREVAVHGSTRQRDTRSAPQAVMPGLRRPRLRVGGWSAAGGWCRGAPSDSPGG